MADNVEVGGVTYATDEVNGVQTQRVKPVFGADGSATDVSPTAGLPVVGGYRELTGSTSTSNTDVIPSTDVRGCSVFYAQITSQFGGTAKIQISSDGTNWIDVYPVYGWTSGTYFISMNSTTNFFYGPLPLRYFRVRTISAPSGGPFTMNVQLSTIAMPNPVAYATPQQITGANTAGMADSQSFPASSNTWGALPLVFNGTNWDRARSALASDGSTGIGIPAAGLMGVDNASGLNRRLKCDTAGNLYQRGYGTPTSAITAVAAATTSTSLLVAKPSRVAFSVYNDSTSPLRIKLGSVAANNSFSCRIAANGYYEPPGNSGVYTGAVDGIWETANGNAMVSEVG